jgi:hypothetical protein
MSYQKILTSLGFEKQRLAIGDRHGDFWVRTASWSDHPLRLELVCGASDVDPEHDAYWGGETLTHPKHDYIEQLAEEQGITASVTGNGVNSDAYLYFTPEQLEKVVDILKEADWRGDILDIMTSLNEKNMLYLSLNEKAGQ